MDSMPSTLRRDQGASAAGGEGAINNVDNTMQWRKTTEYGTELYQNISIPDGDNALEKAPGDYDVRYAATASSFASEAKLVTVTYAKEKTPEPKSDYPYITNLDKNAAYELTDPSGTVSTVTSDSEGRIPAAEEWLEKTVTLVKKGDGVITVDSEAATVEISKIPEQTPEPTTKPTTEPTTEPTAEPTTEPTRKSGHSRRSSATPSPSPEPTGEPSDNTDTPALNKNDHFAYINGYLDGSFKPENAITRAEVAVIFAQLLDDEMSDKDYTSSFADVSREAYYSRYIGFLEQYGILTGYEDGSFRPENYIKRAEFSVIVSKFTNTAETGSSIFTDVAESDWAMPYISKANAAGYLEGYEDGTFRPYNDITRAEAVSVINRVLGRVCDRDFVNGSTGSIKLFNDVSTSHWAYYDIIEASTAHKYVNGSKTEAWTEIE